MGERPRRHYRDIIGHEYQNLVYPNPQLFECFCPVPTSSDNQVWTVMDPRKYKVRLLNEDQLWHRHQNQLHYCQVEDDDTQSAEITGAPRISPITRDPPLSFRITRSQLKMLKELPPIPFQQTVKVGEEHIVTHYRTSYHFVKSSIPTWDS